MKHPSGLIDGQWISSKGFSFCSHNPATGKVVWEGHVSTLPEINQAVNSAQKAFKSWSNLDLKERIERLQEFQSILTKEQEELTEIISLETGKPLWESRNEVSSMIHKVTISINAYAQRCQELRNSLPDALSLTRHKPHGVVVVLGPFNFPAHLPNGHIIPALLAGNTVIFKPSELTPLVAEATMKCWEKTHLPHGVLNMLQGGKETGKVLAEHPDINGLFFTGSWKVGKSLLDHFAQYPQKILALEMGGNNPLVVSKIKNIEAAIYATLQSAYLTSGQRCTCARRLILPMHPSSEIFIEGLSKAIKKIKIGSYQEHPEPFMGPVINEKAAQKALEAQENLRAQGGKILTEMKLLKMGTGFLSPGLMDVSGIDNKPDEEIFAPFLQLIYVKNFDEAIREANQTTYGLAAGLFSDSREEYQIFYQNVKAGIINWNAPLTGASSAAPFGGIGRSGNHRPSAFYAADYSAYPVASIESESLKIPQKLIPGISLS